MAADSGVERARRFREKADQAQRQADEAQRQADRYRRMGDNCEKGVVGEEEVARLLDILDGAGWRVLNDRYKSPTSPVNIDHIAVGPPGVLVIDAKHWSGGPVRLDERGMSHRGHRRDDELDRVRDAVHAVSAHARAAHADVVARGVIAFVGEAGPAEPASHHGVTVLKADQLLGWLTSQPACLNPQQVRHISSTLDAALPPRTAASGEPFALPAAMPTRRSVRPRPGQSAPMPPTSRRRARPPASAGGSPLRRQLLKAALALFLVLVVLPNVLQSFANGVSESLRTPPSTPPVQTVPTSPAVGTPAG